MIAPQINTGIGELRALVAVIQSSVDKLEETMALRNQTYPSLNTLYSSESEAPRTSADVLALGDLVISAAAQLIAAVRPTPISPLLTSLQVLFACIVDVNGFGGLTPSLSSKHPPVYELQSELMYLRSSLRQGSR